MTQSANSYLENGVLCAFHQLPAATNRARGKNNLVLDQFLYAGLSQQLPVCLQFHAGDSVLAGIFDAFFEVIVIAPNFICVRSVALPDQVVESHILKKETLP